MIVRNEALSLERRHDRCAQPLGKFDNSVPCADSAMPHHDNGTLGILDQVAGGLQSVFGWNHNIFTDSALWAPSLGVARYCLDIVGEDEVRDIALYNRGFAGERHQFRMVRCCQNRLREF